MHLPAYDIIHLIPQKPPFVMVSVLLHIDERSARSSFTIHSDNVLIKDNFFSEAGLMENIAQTAALRAGYVAQAENKPVKVGYIGAVKDLEIFSLPKAGDELETEIIISDHIFNMTTIIGKVWLKDQLIASCELKVITEENE